MQVQTQAAAVAIEAAIPDCMVTGYDLCDW
jgi:hypothetical protein